MNVSPLMLTAKDDELLGVSNHADAMGALLLATGELRGELCRLIGQSDTLEQLRGLSPCLVNAPVQNFELSQVDIVRHRNIGKQFKTLKNHADA